MEKKTGRRIKEERGNKKRSEEEARRKKVLELTSSSSKDGYIPTPSNSTPITPYPSFENDKKEEITDPEITPNASKAAIYVDLEDKNKQKFIKEKEEQEKKTQEILLKKTIKSTPSVETDKSPIVVTSSFDNTSDSDITPNASKAAIYLSLEDKNRLNYEKKREEEEKRREDMFAQKAKRIAAMIVNVEGPTLTTNPSLVVSSPAPPTTTSSVPVVPLQAPNRFQYVKPNASFNTPSMFSMSSGNLEKEKKEAAPKSEFSNIYKELMKAAAAEVEKDEREQEKEEKEKEENKEKVSSDATLSEEQPQPQSQP